MIVKITDSTNTKNIGHGEIPYSHCRAFLARYHINMQ